MQSRLLHLHPQTRQKLLRLKQAAECDGAYREARRFHAVLLNADGYTSGQIAALLDAPRSRVSVWLASYERDGWEGLLERIPYGATGRTGRAGSTPPGRHSRQWTGCLWIPLGRMDGSDGSACDRGGVLRLLSPGLCLSFAAPFGLLAPTSPACAGTGRSR